MRISAVLPLSDRVKVRRNIDRAQLLLGSLDYFWRGEDRFSVYIVVPDKELDEIQSNLKVPDSRISINYLTESDVSPLIAAAPQNYGIAKHMLIKLSSNRFTDSEYNLILDSDVVACKPFSEANLVVDQRAIAFLWSQQPQGWWNGSEKVLGYPIDGYRSVTQRIFVTPQILSSFILDQLQENIQRKSGSNWVEHLISAFDPTSKVFWTEYTLYDLFARTEGMFESYHVDDTMALQRLHCMAQSLWVPDNLKKWEPKKAFDGTSVGLFVVLQSIMAHNIDFDVVRDQVIESARSVYPDYPALR